MRLFTTLGPGDIVAAHRRQLAGGAVAHETSIIFSGQLIEYCKAQGISLLGIGSNSHADTIEDGAIWLENLPRSAGSGGLRYHLAQLGYAWRLAARARRYRPDLALIDSGTTHYFALILLRMMGIPVAVNFHNVLWPHGFRPGGGVSKIIQALNGWFFRRHVAAVAGCSPECGIQADALAGHHLPFFEWRGQFRRAGFPETPADPAARPFRLLFVGRTERNKGVLDLPLMAERLEAQHPGLVRIDVCGDGGALAELRAMVADKGLEEVVAVHGRLNRAELLPHYAAAHAVIVPTRGDFCEGLPLVCAEAVISGRPIVTSVLSNALPVLGPAISAAEPEDIDSYVAAILRLALDRQAYQRHVAACPALAQQFFDRSTSYPAAVDRLLTRLLANWRPLPTYNSLFDALNPE